MNEKENFDRCLNKWKKMEKEFAIKMIKKELDILEVEFAPNKAFKDWDVKIKYNENGEVMERTFEIKSDDKSMETGNICFEYMCNWKPSWIYASKADYIVYQIGWEYYMKPRAELLIRLWFIEKSAVKGWDWDRARIYLVNKDKLDVLFNKV